MSTLKKTLVSFDADDKNIIKKLKQHFKETIMKTGVKKTVLIGEEILHNSNTILKERSKQKMRYEYFVKDILNKGVIEVEKSGEDYIVRVGYNSEAAKFMKYGVKPGITVSLTRIKRFLRSKFNGRVVRSEIYKKKARGRSYRGINFIATTKEGRLSSENPYTTVEFGFDHNLLFKDEKIHRRKAVDGIEHTNEIDSYKEKYFNKIAFAILNNIKKNGIKKFDFLKAGEKASRYEIKRINKKKVIYGSLKTFLKSRKRLEKNKKIKFKFKLV